MLDRFTARAWSHLREAERQRLDALALPYAGHGYDVFGLHRDGIVVGLELTRFLYERWFRVESRGAENVPGRGAAIVVANHTGTLPFDALMLWTDVLRRTDPPRLGRPVMDHFVGKLPLVGLLFERAGAVGGSRGNTRALLEAGELLMIFPEGVAGIGKPWRKRYEIVGWTVGHAELAIRHRAPVVPVGIVGPAEQLPQIARLPIRPFGAPYVPVPATPLPLPVRYHVRYGAPIDLHARWSPEEADDPRVAAEAAALVRKAVEDLIAGALRERAGVFR